MKLQESSLVAAVAAACLAVGCASTATTATAPPAAMRGTADAIIHIRGLSCPF